MASSLINAATRGVGRNALRKTVMASLGSQAPSLALNQVGAARMKWVDMTDANREVARKRMAKYFEEEGYADFKNDGVEPEMGLLKSIDEVGSDILEFKDSDEDTDDEDLDIIYEGDSDEEDYDLMMKYDPNNEAHTEKLNEHFAEKLRERVRSYHRDENDDGEGDDDDLEDDDENKRFRLPPDFVSQTIWTDSTQKIIKQGSIMSIRSLVVVGNRQGAAGFGIGKGLLHEDAHNRAMRQAMRSLVHVDLFDKRTLYHEVKGRFNSTKLFLRPRPIGSGETVGDVVRSVLYCFGVSDVVGKIHGSRNQYSVVQATFNALQKHESPEEVALQTGRPVVDLNRYANQRLREEKVKAFKQRQRK